MIDLTPIFQAVIALLAALITYKLVPWIKSKTTRQQQENLFAAARVVVYAAEQLYGAGNGAEKLGYAMEALRRAGYDVNTQLVRETVEQCVKMFMVYEGDPEEPEAQEKEGDEQIHPPEEE